MCSTYAMTDLLIDQSNEICLTVVTDFIVMICDLTDG